MIPTGVSMVVSGGAVSPENRSNEEPNFEGHAERECGEHRTVGPHRAWCYDCSEWCYPERDDADPMDGACNGCRVPWLESALASSLARIAAVEALHFAHGRNILGKPVCAECSPLQPMPCPTLRALAAFPTETPPAIDTQDRKALR